MHELAERALAGLEKAVEPAPVFLTSVSRHDGQPTHAFYSAGQHLFEKPLSRAGENQRRIRSEKEAGHVCKIMARSFNLERKIEVTPIAGTFDNLTESDTLKR